MYFDKFNNELEVKERFRILAMKFHPDLGGDTQIMKEINTEYEAALRRFSGKKAYEPIKERPRATESDNKEWYEKVQRVMEWAENYPDFDITFVMSLEQQIAKNFFLSQKQKNALDKIIHKFKVP